MVKVVKVEFLWSENSLFQRQHKTIEPKTAPSWPTLADANAYLMRMAGEASDIGYDKTAYRITWEDGETYEGRYDLHRLGQRQENRNGFCDIGDAASGFLKFCTGDHRPSHMNADQYAACLAMYRCDEAKRQAARDFLAAHEF